MRIVCQRINHGHWCAWIEGNPESAFTGPTATAAVMRLAEAVEGVDVDRIAPDNESSTVRRYVFLVGDLCPDCKGSGTYIGLAEKSDCGTCSGAGRVVAGRDDDDTGSAGKYDLPDVPF